LLHEIWLVHLALPTFFISYEIQYRSFPLHDIQRQNTFDCNVSLCCYGNIDPQYVKVIDSIHISYQIMPKLNYKKWKSNFSSFERIQSKLGQFTQRMRAYKAGQIPRSETRDIWIFKIKRNQFYCEKWVVRYINYTILNSYI
jgi:hypothetical protein